ncbi:GDSL-type esterase/lipase family protein [Streptomyces sp. NPDC088748]|uniref:GDSL-type esterase/lipase family protein n=1 Tax=Streptomyces sp. NPDC088748 TaxID=3365887 RepID=UPI003826E21E
MSNRKSSRRLRFGAFLTAGALLTGGTAAFNMQTASAVPSQPVIINLGDSFSSGEGSGWKGNSTDSSGNRDGTDMAASLVNGKWVYDPHSVYDDSSNGYPQFDSWEDECHDSRTAPIRRLSNAIPGEYIALFNWACSGAKTKNIYPITSGGEIFKGRVPQITHIKNYPLTAQQDVKMVVIGAGGNDAGFGAIIDECVTAWAKRNIADILYPYKDGTCKDEVRDKFVYNVKDVTYNLNKTIKNLKETLEDQGQAWGSYKVVVTGAPMILPSDESDWSYGEDNMGGRCFINRDDAAWINEHFVTRLNKAMRATADEYGVGFLDTSEAFVGHRLCEAGTVRGSAAAASSSNAEWVRFIDVHLSASSLWEAVKKTGFPFFEWPLREGVSEAAMNSQRHISESLHPNYYGQQAIGKCLSLYYASYINLPDASHAKCFNSAGENGTTEQMGVSTMTPTPVYADNPSPDLAIPQTGQALVRTVTVPNSATPKQFARVFVNVGHPRKGQLSMKLIDPTGYMMNIKDCKESDQTPAVPGTSTFDVPIPASSTTPPRDPSGNWDLRITECNNDAYAGTLKDWKLTLY